MKRLTLPIAIAIFTLVSILAILPLFVVTIPPMVDYPNHLARCAILAGLPNSPLLRTMYEPRGELLPNLAMDAAIVPLAKFMSVALAGRLFCGLVLLTMLSGGVAVSMAVSRKLTWWSFAPALLLYNHIYTFGFLNYLFGVGLMLWGLGLWIWLSRMPATPTVRRLRWLMGAVFATLMFLSHLVAMAMFGVVVAGYEIGTWLEGKRTVKELALKAGTVASMFIFPTYLLTKTPTKSELSAFTPSSLGDKLDWMVNFLRIDPNRLDIFYTVIVIGCVIGLLRTKTLVISKRMGWVMVATVAAFLALPEEFNTCACVDLRIPVIIGFVFVSGTRFMGMRGRASYAFAFSLMAAFFLRSFQVTRDWSLGEATSREVVADVSKLPEHAVLFTAADREANIFRVKGWEPPLFHLPLAAALNKGIFFPQIFALPTQHPLAVRPELRALEAFQDTEPLGFSNHEELTKVVEACRTEANDLEDVPPNLGRAPQFYLFVVKNSDFEPTGKVAGATLLTEHRRYALYRIEGTQQAALERQKLWQQESLAIGKPIGIRVLR